MLWSEAMNPTVNGQNETKRMISEKLAATQEGIVGAQMALGQAMMENFAAMMFGQMPKATPQGTVDAMLQASLAPAARKVRANIKRLSKN
jgi:hypothetical protein